MAGWTRQIVVICLVPSAGLNALMGMKKNIQALRGNARRLRMTLLIGQGKRQIAQVNIQWTWLS